MPSLPGDIVRRTKESSYISREWAFFLVLPTFDLFVQEKEEKKCGARLACLMLLVPNTLEKVFRSSSSLKLCCKTTSHGDLKLSAAYISAMDL